jgi:AraC family ethanolamine operon transcriptional activator
MRAPTPLHTRSEPTRPDLSAAVWNQRVATADIDAHAAAQPHWKLHYEQLSPGRFEGLVHHVQLPLMRLVHEWCSVAVRQQGRFVEGRYGFAMGLHAHAEPAIFNGQRVEHDGVMLGRHGELDLRSPAGFGLIAVVVDADLLVPLWEHLYGKPPSSWIESQLVAPARPAVAQSLRDHHMTVLAEAAAYVDRRARESGDRKPDDLGPDGREPDGRRPPDGDDTAARQLRDALLIEWLEALPPSIDASGLPGALARKRIVDRACEVMLASTDEPLSMLEVCRRVGASRRNLNYCFKDVLNTSPLKYLRAVRLNGVRRELLRDAPTVIDAAARWGFWQLGQFSHDYKQQFGELPSATLKGRGTPTTRRSDA